MSASGSQRPPKLLAIDDDPLVRRSLAHLFAEPTYALSAVDDGITGFESVQRERPDVVILDNVLPDISGLEVLAKIREFDRYLPVIFVTAQGTSRTAIEAMKLCAFDYLPKPLDFARLQQQVERAVEARRLMRTPVQIDDGRQTDADADLLIGRSPAMHEVFKSIGRVALLNAPILIEGESGTGKESVARAVYQSGPRAIGPFCVVNCADLDAAELEAELFGCEEMHEGKETTTRVGRMEQSARGVLVLNEISCLSATAQSRLLRLLRDGEYERIGGRQTQRNDVQIIALNSLPLEPLVAEKRFRTDLYYLLRSFRIDLPPLRQRADDLPLLVDHFVKQFSRLRGAPSKDPVRVSPESLALLIRYAWPGNLDELQSVLRRALVETKGTIVASDFLSSALGERKVTEQSGVESVTDWHAFAETRMADGSQRLYADAVAEMERRLLSQVLTATHGNQARSARMLGITRGNLRKKLRTLGLTASLQPSVDDRCLPQADEDE